MLYDLDSNILSIELAKDAIVDTKEIGNILIHVSKIGKPVLIEILNASKLIGKKTQLPSLEQLQKLMPNF
jgi:uncharacterized protein YuzE